MTVEETLKEIARKEARKSWEKVERAVYCPPMPYVDQYNRGSGCHTVTLIVRGRLPGNRCEFDTEVALFQWTQADVDEIMSRGKEKEDDV